MQPVRQRLSMADSIFSRMRANDLEAVVKRSKGTEFGRQFQKTEFTEEIIRKRGSREWTIS